MSDDIPADTRATKILADLLALVLAEGEQQAASAMAAIRRRAAADGVTGGAIKALVARLLELRGAEQQRGLLTSSADPQPELEQLRTVVAQQRRELSDTWHARHLTEAAMADMQATNMALSEQIGGLRHARRNGWLLGFVLGLSCVALALGMYVAVSAVLRHRPHAALSSAATQALQETIGACFVRSTNSLGGGIPFDVKLVLELDAKGRIAAASVAPEQAALLADPLRARYADLLLRTLRGGSCGPLPLPPALRGKAGPLLLDLPQ